MGAMKVLLTLALSGAALLAQTPPPATKAPTKAATPPAASKTGTATKTGTAAKAPAKKAAGPPAALLNPAAARLTAPELYRVKFTTTKGDFVVEVNRSWAPIGADRFYNLVRNRYFVDAAFFRIVPNFIVQFGMHADPKINAVWSKANIKDDPVKQGNKRGTLVFATAGPNTRTTQLFINLKDNTSSLDGQGFAAFGTVTEGMDTVVDKLYSGYGEGGDMGGRGPTQGRLAAEGKPYLDKGFPLLDSIKSATVIFPEGPPAPPPAPAKKAAPAATKTGTTAAPATKTAPPAAPKKVADPGAAAKKQ
jgi:peptidyl-prolyl cis-trans isomerase A (cyclophilin A)